MRKILAFLAGIIIILILFNNLLWSRSEAFYMSVPVCWFLYYMIFNREYILHFMKFKRLFYILSGTFAAVGIVFYGLKILMAGEIVWKEVVLAMYFLFSVKIVVDCMKKVIRDFGNTLSSVFVNEKVAKFVSSFVIVVLWISIVIPYILSVFSIHRPKIGDKFTPETEYNLDYIDISFETVDRIKLHGWFVPREGSSKCVIIGHGLGVNKSNFLRLVSMWHDLNFNVLIFDFRGHGQSEGHTISFGYNERLDIRAAVEYLVVTKKDFDPSYILGYGVSFGGASMIHAAAEESKIDMVIVDSAFCDIKTMARKLVDRIFFVPPFLKEYVVRAGLFMVSLDLGFDIQERIPGDSISLFVNQPVLIIHSKKDRLVPFAEGINLYDKAKEPKSIYSIGSGDHYATLYDARYFSVIKEFINKY